MTLSIIESLFGLLSNGFYQRFEGKLKKSLGFKTSLSDIEGKHSLVVDLPLANLEVFGDKQKSLILKQVLKCLQKKSVT